MGGLFSASLHLIVELGIINALGKRRCQLVFQPLFKAAGEYTQHSFVICRRRVIPIEIVVDVLDSFIERGVDQGHKRVLHAVGELRGFARQFAQRHLNGFLVVRFAVDHVNRFADLILHELLSLRHAFDRLDFRSLSFGP